MHSQIAGKLGCCRGLTTSVASSSLTKGTQKGFKRDSKGTENGVFVCMSHKERCPWDSVELKKGASETALT